MKKSKQDEKRHFVLAIKEVRCPFCNSPLKPNKEKTRMVCSRLYKKLCLYSIDRDKFDEIMLAHF